MVIFYKKCKKYNEIQLTKKQNGLNYNLIKMSKCINNQNVDC